MMTSQIETEGIEEVSLDFDLVRSETRRRVEKQKQKTTKKHKKHNK